MIRSVFTLVTVLAIAAPIASAVNFSDDFEGGSLSPALWLINGHGQIVTDPLNASNHVLSFSALGAGGDIFSVPLDLSAPEISLSFDYLGLDSTPSVGTNTGGFVIVDLPNSFLGFSLLGTSSAGNPKLSDMLNLAPGVWHHISVTFAPSLVAAGDGSKITFEQWVSSPNAAGNAFFDNIQLTPEPGTMLLSAGGLLLAGLVRARRRQP